jgi:hypothetical protein
MAHDLHERLPKLAARETALRQESNTVCYHSPGPDGQPAFHIANQARFAAIGQELQAIADERAKIESKLGQLKELLGDNGPNCIPDVGSDPLYIDRLRAELGQIFFHRIMSNNGGRFRLPEEAMMSEEYARAKAEIMPKIESAQARIAKNNELAVAANAILNS